MATSCRRVSAVVLAADCVKEGHLGKESTHKNWKQRYAILTADALYFFVSPAADWVKSVVPLGRGTELYDLDRGPGLLRGYFWAIAGRCTERQRQDALFCGTDSAESHVCAETKEDK
jgi:hypothetical protein